MTTWITKLTTWTITGGGSSKKATSGCMCTSRTRRRPTTWCRLRMRSKWTSKL